MLAVACGGGGTKTVAEAGKIASQTPAASASAGQGLTAAALLPKLTDIGFTLTRTGKPTVNQAGLDAAIGQYTSTSPAMGVCIEISLFPDVATATSRFTILSDALRNPPPGLFGPNSTQKDATRPGPGDEGKSYVTSQADGQGNYIWSDSYRFGRAFVVVYTLGKDPVEAATVRKEIALRLQAEIK